MTHADGERPIQVLLVEDAPVQRQRLRALIEASALARVVAEAGSVAAALFLLPSTPVDVLLLNLHLWDGDGCRVLAEAKRLHPDCLALVLSGPCTAQERVRWQDLGAAQVLDQDRDLERIPEVLATLRPHASEPMP